MRKILFHIAVLLALATSVEAQDVPRVISYQGVLVGADGKPVSGNVDVTFELMPLNGAPSITWSEQRKGLAIRGGLFHVFLGDSSMPKGFPILSGEYALSIKVGTNAPNFVRFGSVPYALNIPNDVVTSAKIKDGTIVGADLSNMGATENQVLTRTGNTWSGKDIPKELPEQASEGAVLVFKNGQWQAEARTTELPTGVNGQILVYRNGQWQAENLVVPTGVPIGTIVAFYGLISQIHPDWLLCDGRSITQQQYPLLFNHLNALYNSSILPDLRGMFLRGADLGTNQDPDNAITVGKRQYPTGIGANTDKIGSAQQDAFQGHWHEFIYMAALVTSGSMGINQVATPSEPTKSTIAQTVRNPIIDGEHGIPRTSSETRPKNVYVNYIIKAR